MERLQARIARSVYGDRGDDSTGTQPDGNDATPVHSRSLLDAPTPPLELEPAPVEDRGPAPRLRRLERG